LLSWRHPGFNVHSQYFHRPLAEITGRPADSVHVVKTGITERFVSDLAPLVKAAGAELKVFDDTALPDHDIWIQDAVEIGYATNGKRVMHVALHGNLLAHHRACRRDRFMGAFQGR
jgi:hypothetical protein